MIVMDPRMDALSASAAQSARMRRAGTWLSGAVVAILSLALGSCGFISKDGPQGIQIRNSAEVTLADTTNAVGYALVALSPPALKAANDLTLSRTPVFQKVRGGARDVRIGVGDVVSLTIFEAAAGGLFIPAEPGSRQGNFVNLPSQQVDAAGQIAVPYAGPVKVLGLTPNETSREIARLLSNRAVEPQVVVSITDRRGGGISVLGDVNLPARLQVEPGGIRILEAIARAGGPKNPPYETIVTLKRGERTYQAAMGSLVKLPGQNVPLAAGDVVYVSREQKVFLALGATPAPGSIGGTNNRRFPFDNDNMTLAEAAAKAGGLDPTRANPQSVFLYRLEGRGVLEGLGVDTSGFDGDAIPTIYTIDLSRGDAFFVSNSFYMRDKDIIYVAEAPAVDVGRFTAALNGVTSNASLINGIR